MIQSILTLFETWIVSQENTIYYTRERICTCLEYCKKNVEEINAHHIEKYIDDICRKLQQIQQYQRSIESFIQAASPQLENHHVEKYHEICKTISCIEQDIVLLFVFLQQKTRTLQTNLHYAAIFQSQLQ